MIPPIRAPVPVAIDLPADVHGAFSRGVQSACPNPSRVFRSNPIKTGSWTTVCHPLCETV
jgi:hypothetical protein